MIIQYYEYEKMKYFDVYSLKICESILKVVQNHTNTQSFRYRNTWIWNHVRVYPFDALLLKSLPSKCKFSYDRLDAVGMVNGERSVTTDQYVSIVCVKNIFKASANMYGDNEACCFEGTNKKNVSFLFDEKWSCSGWF